MTKIPAAEFKGYLEKGFGRAHLVLQEGGGDELVEVLMMACLKNPTYDAQVEGSRATYLFELVNLARAEAQLTAELADLMRDEPSDHDLDQRFELAGLLARDASPSMRGAMYRGMEQFIDRWLAERPIVLPSREPARQLIALDGLRGAIFAFSQLGRLADAIPDYWDDEDLLNEVRSSLDGGEADLAIANARRTDRNVDAYIRAVERQISRRPERDSSVPARRWWMAPWVEAQRTIERYVRGTDRTGYFAWQWGNHASDEELAIAARALLELPKDDLELLRPYLCVFGRRAFPLDPSPLIDLIDDPRDKVAWFALNALEQLRNPAVRATALRMAESGPVHQRALDLLATNWEPGDELIAERLLTIEENVDAIHSMANGLRDVIERQLTADLVPALLIGYERSPCSECRNRFVAALLRLDALPRALSLECRWDASPETRQLVA